MDHDDDMPSMPYLAVSAVVTAPLWIPALAVFGAYHGVKAAIVHGIVPGVKKIAAASKKA